MSYNINHPLSKSHICNTWQVRHRLVAAIAIDLGRCADIKITHDHELLHVLHPYKFKIVGLTQSERLSQIAERAVYEFLNSYVITPGIFAAEYLWLKANLPNFFVELILLSNLSCQAKVSEIKAILASLPFLALNPHITYHLARLSLDKKHNICSYELNPLTHNLNGMIGEIIASSRQFGCYLGVSAGHMMYLADFYINRSSSEEFTIYCAPNELYAMNPFTPSALLPSAKSFVIYQDHSLEIYSPYFLDDEISLYYQLELAGLMGQANVASTNSLDSKYCFPRYESTCRYKQIINYPLDSFRPHPTIIRFFETYKRIICIHQRDSRYSGGSELRNTSLHLYLGLVDRLITDGCGVILLSLSTEASPIYHPQVLDFSANGFSSLDQLYCLKHSQKLLGTASGISHLWSLSGIPTIFVNTVALPSTHITDSVVHSPKRISCLKQTFSGSFKSLVRSIMHSTWDSRLMRLFDIRPLSTDELISEFYNWELLHNANELHEFPTCHLLWSSLFDSKPSIPDYYLTEPAFDNLQSELRKQRDYCDTW